MEKQVPHTRLAIVQEMVRAGQVKMTRSAVEGAEELGLCFQQVCLVLLNLSSRNFLKSMTTYHDYRIWQDVYRTVVSGRYIYLKMTVADSVLVISFKEK